MSCTHGFKIDPDRCRGCLSCMRVCPTHAIRVRDGKARYRSDHCIDCGACLRACPSGAIAATTWSVEDLSRFKFKVAVPSPVLFGQFPAGITPAQIVERAAHPRLRRGLGLLGGSRPGDPGDP